MSLKIGYMFVCLCKAVTDTQIREAVDQGHASLQAMQAKLQVSTSCGACACEVDKIIDERIQQNLSSSTASGTASIKEIRLAV